MSIFNGFSCKKKYIKIFDLTLIFSLLQYIYFLKSEKIYKYFRLENDISTGLEARSCKYMHSFLD
jgi:hypothetical protein